MTEETKTYDRKPVKYVIDFNDGSTVLLFGKDAEEYDNTITKALVALYTESGKHPVKIPNPYVEHHRTPIALVVSDVTNKEFLLVQCSRISSSGIGVVCPDLFASDTVSLDEQTNTDNKIRAMMPSIDFLIVINRSDSDDTVAPDERLNSLASAAQKAGVDVIWTPGMFSRRTERE